MYRRTYLEAGGSGMALFGGVGTGVAGADWLTRTGAAQNTGAWQQVAKLVADDGANKDNFGSAVALDGSRALVGAESDKGPSGGPDRGAAYVFERQNGTWRQQTKLVPDNNDSEDLFGGTAALEGDRAVIAAFGDVSQEGEAYVFERNGGEWRQEAKLVPDDLASSAGLGYDSLVLDGDQIFIAAPFAKNSNGTRTGSVYVFERSGGEWRQEAKLTPDDGDQNDTFGIEFSVDGDRILIGAIRHNDPNGENAGAAYVFERSGGEWRQEAKLAANDGDNGDGFGHPSLDGSRAVIGANAADPNGKKTGSAYVFERSGGEWRQQAKLVPTDGDSDDEFGVEPVLDGDRVLIGAFRDNDPNGADAGSVYVFEQSSGEWRQQTKLVPDDGDSGDNFGGTLTLDGDRVLIGAFRDNDPNGENAGAAYIFRRSDGSDSGAPPTPSFEITGTGDTPGEVEIGTEVTLDASDSTDSDGSIRSYEWDVDNDGTFEIQTNEPTTTHAFSTVGEQTITLRVTDTDGNTVRTTQSVTVHLDQYFDTIARAQRIDESSVLSVIENKLPNDQTLDGAREQAIQSLAALETAVKNGSLPQDVAQQATTRLLLAESASLHTVNRVGPSTPSSNTNTFNIARLVARKTISVALTLTIMAVSVAVAGSGGLLGAAAASGAVDLALGAVGHFLGDMLGGGRTKQRAEELTRQEADGIVEQLKDGEIPSVDDLVQVIDSAVDTIVSTISDGLRAIVDLSAVDPIFGTLGTPGIIFDLATDATDSVYGSLDELYTSTQPAEITGGLQGSTQAVSNTVGNFESAVDDTLATTTEFIENLSFAAGELGVFESLIDAFNSEEPSLTELATVLGAAIDAFFGGVVSVLTESIALLSGFGTLSYLRTQQAQLVDGVKTGEEVSFTNV